MRTLPLLLLLAALGCAPTSYRLGVRAEADGRFYEACQHWLDALDRDVEALGPRGRLAELAPDAWEQLLALAAELEASGKYEDSLKVYDQMFAFEAELAELEMLSFDPRPAHAQRDVTLASWATAERAKGDKAEVEGRLAEASAHYDKVRELLPLSGGLDAKQAITLRKWAEQELAAGRYAEAAAHYRRSHALGRDPAMAAWGAAIEAALGRHALAAGRCRIAVDWLDKAADAVGDPDLPADRARAEACAKVGLIVDPVAEEVELKAGSASLGDMFRDLLEERIAARASRYVRLISEDALAGATEAPDRRLRVMARLTQAAVEAPTSSERPMETVGDRLDPCTKEELRLDPEMVCSVEVDLAYVEERTAVAVRLAGSVRVVDLRTGEQSTVPLELVHEDAVLVATKFEILEEGARIPTDVAEQVGPGKAAVSAEILALARPAPPFPPEGQRVAAAARELADKAADAVIAAIDGDEELAPPARLELRDPYAANRSAP